MPRLLSTLIVIIIFSAAIPAAYADVATFDITTFDIATFDIVTFDIATSDIATSDVVASDIATSDVGGPSGNAPRKPAVVSQTGINLHGGVGCGLALMTSDTLTDLFDDQYGIGLGLHLSGSVAVGYRNYIQGEARFGDSSHTLRDNNIVTNETTEIPMDYDFREVVLKANLLALSAGGRAGRANALFVLGGTTNIEYVDDAGDGFKGSALVLGLEYTRFARLGSVTMGIRRYGIEFDRITLGDAVGSITIKASNWVLHTSYTVGIAL